MRIEITAVPSVSDGAGRRYRTGQVVDVDDELARAWVDAGHARRASGRSASKRTAVRRPPNTAKAQPKPKGTGRSQEQDGGPAASEPPGSSE